MTANDTLLSVIRAAVLILVVVGAPCVVCTREPLAQSIAFSLYALVLAVLFVVFQAPDVALSQIVVGAVASPLMILLTLSRIRRNEQGRREVEERP